MFGKSKAAKLKETGVSASELALQLARDKKFRRRLVSAIEHGSQARRRARRGSGLAGTVRRLAADQALQAELRRTRNDLQQAYTRVDAKRRSGRLRKMMLLTGFVSVAVVPQLRDRVSRLVAKAPRDKQQLQGLTTRVRSTKLRKTRPQSLEDLTRDDLYARAQEEDIPGRSEMSKEQLIAALRARA